MSGTVSIGGIGLRFDHYHDLTGIIEVFALDVYSLGAIKRDSAVIDLGAGIGDFAVAAGRKLRGSGFVLAVEPNPRDFACLQENIRLNQLRNVWAENCALGEAPGTITLSFKGETFLTRVVNLNELLQTANLNLELFERRPVFLKLDVEGAEIVALHILQPLISHVDTIALELHGTRGQVDAFLRPQGFSFTRISRGKYLLNAVVFALRHPKAARTIWCMFKSTPDFHGMRSILRGIEISNSENLAVGIYRRRRASRNLGNWPRG